MKSIRLSAPSKLLPLFRELTPVVLGRFGMQLISMVAVAAVGRFSTQELAAFTVALFPYFTLVLVSLCLGGGIPLFAAREQVEDPTSSTTVTLIFRLALWTSSIATGMGLIMAFLMHALPQTPPTYKQAAPLLALLSLSIFGTVFHYFAITFLQGLRRNTAAATTTGLGFLSTLFFAEVLVRGYVSWLPQGAAGAALALVFSRYLMALRSFFHLKPHLKKGRGVSADEKSFLLKKLLWFGTPIALSFGLRSLAFSLLSLVLGFYSPGAVAVFGILMNLNLFLTMFPTGLAAVGSVRIIQTRSCSEPGALVRQLHLVLFVHLAWVGILSAVLFLFPFSSWAGFLTKDPRILATLQLSVGGCWLLFCGDSTIALSTGLLRALGDTWFSQVAVGLSLLGFVLPGALFVMKSQASVSIVIYLCGGVLMTLLVPISFRIQKLVTAKTTIPFSKSQKTNTLS